MSRDHRTHARHTVRIPGRLRAGGATVHGTIENLGVGGAFFSTDDLETAVAEGSKVEVEWVGARAGSPVSLRVPGVVLRIERTFDGAEVVRAFAVRFDALLDLSDLPPGPIAD